MRISQFVASTESRDRWIAIGRTLLASGTLLTLLLTPMNALLVSVGGAKSGAHCAGIRSASLLCLGDPSQFVEVRRWVMILILLFVIVGYRPRVTGFLHAWVAFTMAVSISLPDGGDSIGLIICLLLLPITVADNRQWQWARPSAPLESIWQAIVAVAHLAIRVQVAFIYLDSGISKFAVSDWSNGTAEYYIVRDPMFGVSGPLAPLVLWFSNMPIGTLSMTWGAIVIEIAIGLTLLFSWRWRILALTLDAALHIAIIGTVGLWSFSLIMIGASVFAASPLGRQQQPDIDVDTKPTESGWPALFRKRKALNPSLPVNDLGEDNRRSSLIPENT